MATGGDQGIHLTVDAGDWYNLSRGLKAFDPALVTQLRKRLRDVGRVAVEEVRKTLGMPSPGDGPDKGTYRAMLAAATKVSISFSSRSAGLTVKTSNKSLPEKHRAIMRAYNLKTFRHPVFGNRTDWVNQPGRPYFGAEFQKLVLQRAKKEAEEAIADAARTLEQLYNRKTL